MEGTPAISWATRIISPIRILAIVAGKTIPTTDYGGVLSTWNQGLFYLQMWTDNGQASGGASPYSNFAAAYAASAAGVPGVYAAQTAPFLVDLGPGGKCLLTMSAN